MVKWTHSSSLSTGTVCIGSAHGVTALCCLLPEVGQLGLCEMSYVCELLSVGKDDFYTALEVRCWVAALCQLIVMVDGRLVTGCQHTIGPTLGTNFVSWALPLPSGEMTRVLGPW